MAPTDHLSVKQKAWAETLTVLILEGVIDPIDIYVLPNMVDEDVVDAVYEMVKDGVE